MVPIRSVMRTHSPVQKSLSPEDLLFLNAYFSNGGNRVKAYQVVHPHAKYDTANSQGYRLFQKPHIQAELARRTRYEAGITREFVQSTLLTCHTLAMQKDDYLAGASIAMDCAKLAGFLVQKHEDVTAPPTVDQATLVEELRRRGYVPVATTN